MLRFLAQKNKIKNNATLRSFKDLPFNDLKAAEWKEKGKEIRLVVSVYHEK